MTVLIFPYIARSYGMMSRNFYKAGITWCRPPRGLIWQTARSSGKKAIWEKETEILHGNTGIDSSSIGSSLVIYVTSKI